MRALAAALAVGAAVLTLVSCEDLPFDAGTSEPSFSFEGGFETGDYSQWSQVNYLEEETPARIALVEEPVRDGRFAARFEVRPGDKTSPDNEIEEDASGERAEVARRFSGQEMEGDEFYYSVSMFLPDDWEQEQDGWRIPLQFHSVNEQLGGRSPSPPVALNILPPEGRPNGNGAGGLWLNVHGGDVTYQDDAVHNDAEVLPLPLRTGVWHDFIVYVDWEPDNGDVRVWHRIAGEGDFALRAELTDVPTLLYITEPERSVSGVYMRQGLYRADNENGNTDVLYLDATRRGDSFDDMVEGFDSAR